MNAAYNSKAQGSAKQTVLVMRFVSVVWILGRLQLLRSTPLYSRDTEQQPDLIHVVKWLGAAGTVTTQRCGRCHGTDLENRAVLQQV